MSAMNQLKRITSLIILTLWASCMIHCDAAQLFVNDPLVCCAEASSDRGPSSPVHCVCHLAKSGSYVSASCRIQVPLAIQIATLEVVATPEAPRSDIHFCSDDLIHSPPELISGWQFSSKTAASPRAPSLLS
jgi:hypothetical protein